MNMSQTQGSIDCSHLNHNLFGDSADPTMWYCCYIHASEIQCNTKISIRRIQDIDDDMLKPCITEALSVFQL
jgi:hypothetical protein